MKITGYTNKAVTNILKTLEQYPADIDTKIKVLSAVKCEIQQAMDTLEYIRYQEEEATPTIEIKIDIKDLM